MQDVEVFDRSAVAEIVGLNYPVIKNWSLGNPLKIMPSVYAPNRKGAQSLYSRTDIYLFELAKQLADLGLALDSISKAFEKIQLSWLDPQERGVLLLAGLKTKNVFVDHVSGKLKGNDATYEYARKIMPVMFNQNSSLVLSAHLTSILGDVDKRILKHKGTQGHEKKSR